LYVSDFESRKLSPKNFVRTVAEQLKVLARLENACQAFFENIF